MNSSNYGSYYGWKMFHVANPYRDVLYTAKLLNTKAGFDTSIVFQVSARAEFCEARDCNTHNEVCFWGMLYDSVY